MIGLTTSKLDLGSATEFKLNTFGFLRTFLKNSRLSLHANESFKSRASKEGMASALQVS